jgi:hypothetical protein
MNGVGRGLERLGQQPISLGERSLLRAARRASGLEDFGDDGFRPGLQRLLRSLEEDAQLNFFGRFMARRQLLEVLEHRLLLIERRKREPEIAEGRIERPLFVLGLPRTGTTLLHGLLAADPAARAPLSWEVDSPDPPPQASEYETDPRIERTEKRFEQLRSLAPGFQTIHPIGSRMPQECIVLMAPEFMSMRFEMTFGVWGYQQWLLEQDRAGAYRCHHDFLQHLQWRGPRGRWVLKSPAHLDTIETLLSQYPDAMIVQTHRDPVRVIPSVASLEVTMRRVGSDAVDPHRVGRENLAQWKRLLDCCMETRDRRPDVADRIVDVHLDEIVADPMRCVHTIYERFGLEMNLKAETAMKAFLAAHPRDLHGVHRYDLASFGLEAHEVEEAFDGYCERFGVRREPPPVL